MQTVHRFLGTMKLHKFVFLLIVVMSCVQLIDGFWLWGNDNKDKVDGKWSRWSNYSSCQLPTDGRKFPYRFRTRNCNNPAPKAGGEPCKGQSLRKAPCSDCDWPLGIESKVIKDSSITASTYHEEFPAKSARLNGPSAWCAKELSSEVFLQVDFEDLTLVTAIATQGYYPDPKELSLRLGSVSKYQITFSDDGITFEVYTNSQNNKVFIGNGNNRKTVLNTFDPQIAAKHIRIHPTAFIKFVCMKIELYGCRFKCGGYLPTKSGDLLAVSSESEDVDCFWQAQLPNSSKITFDFINFDLPCKYGQVELRGSYPFYGGSKLLGNFCSKLALAPPTIESIGSKLWIRFQSKSANPLVGFYGIYFPSCDIILNKTLSGTLSSPGYPKLYNHNSKCTWSIIVPEGHFVKLEFLDFDIEEDPDCSNDYLSVLNGNSSVIGQYCNSRKPPRFVCSNSNIMRLYFKTDDVFALKGFQAKYRAINAAIPCIDPSSSISPSPSLSIPITPTTVNATASVLMSTIPVFPTGIAPTATVVSSSNTTNKSLGGLLTGNGVSGSGSNHGNKAIEEDDGDEDTGLTTIIIISVFSFIVLCMIIASVIPSMIHGYEKRKREREWMAATDLSMKKNCVENEYEMQPIKPHDNRKSEEMEPYEETALLDPDNPCYDNLKDSPYPDTGSEYSNKDEHCTDDPVDEDLECDLEYDTTDLNLSISYEDIGSSFATEMAALMHNYKSVSPSNHPSRQPPKLAEHDTSQPLSQLGANAENKSCVPNDNKDIDTQVIEMGEESEQHNNNENDQEENDSNEVNTKEHSDALNQASDCIPEVKNPETCTNSTVSVSDSQDIPIVPSIEICQPVWEKNTMVDNDNPGNARKNQKNTVIPNEATQNELNNTVNCSSNGGDMEQNQASNVGPETFV